MSTVLYCNDWEGAFTSCQCWTVGEGETSTSLVSAGHTVVGAWLYLKHHKTQSIVYGLKHNITFLFKSRFTVQQYIAFVTDHQFSGIGLPHRAILFRRKNLVKVNIFTSQLIFMAALLLFIFFVYTLLILWIIFLKQCFSQFKQGFMMQRVTPSSGSRKRLEPP